MDEEIHEIIQINVENNSGFNQIIKELGKSINNYSIKDIERLYKKYLDEKINGLQYKVGQIARIHANNKSEYKLQSLDKLLDYLEELEVTDKQLHNKFYDKLWLIYTDTYSEEKEIIKKQQKEEEMKEKYVRGNEKIRKKIDAYVQKIMEGEGSESQITTTLFRYAGINPSTAITDKSIEEWFEYYQQELQKQKQQRKKQKKVKEEKSSLVKKPLEEERMTTAEKSREIIEKVKEQYPVIQQIKKSVQKKKQKEEQENVGRFKSMKIVNDPIPFRTANKVKALAKIINPENPFGQIQKHEEKMMKTDYGHYFPLKETKKYYMSTVDEPDTYMFDIMFFSGSTIGYLIAIEVNTRKAYAEALNLEKVIAVLEEASYDFGEIVNNAEDEYVISKKIKSTENFQNTLPKIFEKIENDGRRIRKFLMDGEAAVKGLAIQEYFKKEKILYQTLTSHNATSRIDRFIRTLRDMVYTLDWDPDIISIEQMDYLIKFYNNAPHRGLKKWLNVDISPNQVTYEIEDLLIRKVLWSNKQVREKSLIPIGVKVIVYDPKNQDYLGIGKNTMTKRRRRTLPGDWYVINNIKNNYEIQDKNTGKTLYVSRWVLSRY